MAQRFDRLIAGPQEKAPAAPPAPRRGVWIVQVLAIWLAARLVTTVALLVMHANLPAGSRGAGTSNLIDYSTIWDGQWYWLIAYSGYPTELPVTSSGAVAESAWAFMPLYPLLSGGVALVTGVDWPIAGVTVAVLFGFAASIVVYLLFRTRLSHGRSLFSVALVAVGPASFIFQMAYAESMQLFLLALALLLLVRRRWGLLVPVIAVMALTRPTGLAFALALALYFVARRFGRAREPFERREQVKVAALTVFSGLAGLAWAGIAWAVTGSPTAYTDTELAWRGAWIGETAMVPFAAWFQAAPFWVGETAGPFVVAAIMVGFVLLFITRRVRRLGLEMRVWVLAYGVYLFAVFFPQSSLIRLLIPMFPLAGALAPERSRVAGSAILVVTLAAQMAWLWATWGMVPLWWSVP